MDAVHIHLIVNHIPVLGSIFGFLLLLVGIIQKNNSYSRVAIAVLIISGIFAVVALQSGEGAEEAVEGLPGVTEGLIHEHEEAAEGAMWISVVTGLLAIGGLFLEKMRPEKLRSFLIVVLIGSAVASGYMGYTAYLGGQIRHTEIRPQNSVVQQNGDHEEGENEAGEYD